MDYLGATGAGMQAVLMDIPGAYRDKGVPRVESLEELQIVLRDGESARDASRAGRLRLQSAKHVSADMFVFDSARFLIFLSAAILLAIAPGPGMLYVLARALGGGRREGLLSALGTFFGGMVHVFAAAAGISIVLAKSAMAFLHG